MDEKKALLTFEDGTVFQGHTKSSFQSVRAEVIFNTSLTGYQEVCTDPSYAGQIVVFTTSHIGNVGVNAEDCESARPSVAGIVVRSMSKVSSSWRSEQSLISFLEAHQVPWIEGVDTRRLTRYIRTQGPQKGCLQGMDFNQRVKLPSPSLESTPMRAYARQGAPLIVVYDFGVKAAILRALMSLHCRVEVISSAVSAAHVLALNPDGIVLSNGPGDPSAFCVDEVRAFMESGVPVLGICLGCQLIALAAGGKTRKMQWGQHGTNHPVHALKNDRVYIMSQNHNFVVDEASLPADFEVTHRSLLDGSIQGICSQRLPVRGIQGHPEGRPGPREGEELFAEFVETVRAQRCP